MFEAQDAALPPLFRYVARIPSRTALSSAIQTTPPRSGDALFLDHPHRRGEGPAGMPITCRIGLGKPQAEQLPEWQG
jgi:hypothetical protein